MSAITGDFFGGGALAAPVVRAPIPTAAMAAQAVKNKQASDRAAAKRAEEARQSAQASYVAKRALVLREEAAARAKLQADPGPAGQAYRATQKKIHGGGGGWLSDVLKVTEKAATAGGRAALSAVQKGVGVSAAIGRELSKLPVVGGGLAGAWALTNSAIVMAGHVTSGKPLDQIALNALQSQVSAAKAVAPYVQTVLSFVPVVGTGINAGLGAGLALASGQSITEALAASVAAALPGGPLARSAFQVARGVVAGKPLDQLAINALPIDANAKRALTAGFDAARRIAKGERVDKAVLAQADDALALLPKEVRAAVNAGVALGSGQVLQAAGAAVGAVGAVGKVLPPTKGMQVLSLPKIKVSVPSASSVVSAAQKAAKSPAATLVKAAASAAKKPAAQVIKATNTPAKTAVKVVQNAVQVSGSTAKVLTPKKPPSFASALAKSVSSAAAAVSKVPAVKLPAVKLPAAKAPVKSAVPAGKGKTPPAKAPPKTVAAAPKKTTAAAPKPTAAAAPKPAVVQVKPTVSSSAAPLVKAGAKVQEGIFIPKNGVIDLTARRFVAAG